MRSRLGQTLLRTSWLMLGAAIGLAAVLLLVSLGQVIAPNPGVGQRLVVAACLLPALSLGLLPGVRELEVTAAHSLLGVSDPLPRPEPVRPEHRLRTAVLVVAHQGIGLLAAVLVVGVVPGLVVLAVGAVRGRTDVLRELNLPTLTGPVGVLLALLGVALCLLGTWALGRLAADLAPRLLGATGRDRLAVALARLAAESEHTRLARELHDGIGHALTVISVQATAARHDPTGPDGALGTIEATARQALDELDGMLGLLRGDEASRTSEPELDQLPALVAAYRSAGMDLMFAGPGPEAPSDGPLPRLVSTTAYRIAAEALTNAQRHGSSGPVRLSLRRAPDRLTIEAVNPLGSRPRVETSHGLNGIAERVALFGGTFRAGAERSDWVLHAEIPTGGRS